MGSLTLSGIAAVAGVLGTALICVCGLLIGLGKLLQRIDGLGLSIKALSRSVEKLDQKIGDLDDKMVDQNERIARLETHTQRHV